LTFVKISLFAFRLLLRCKRGKRNVTLTLRLEVKHTAYGNIYISTVLRELFRYVMIGMESAVSVSRFGVWASGTVMSRHPLVAVYGERGIERFKRAFCGGATGRCNIRCNISVCKRCSL